MDYCTTHTITFTRSRSGNKNDGAHVEQKNWTHVRQLVGYLRFDTDAELELLNQIWRLDGVFTNCLLAQQKLIEKHRHGAKDTKRYDRAQTPYVRALAHDGVTEASRRVMDETFATIRVASIYDQIQTLTGELEHVSLTKGLASIRRVNKAFNRPLHPEVFDEATIHASRRI